MRMTKLALSAAALACAQHATDHDGVSIEEALERLRENSGAATAAVGAFTDEQLDRAAPVSLNDDAPLTCLSRVSEDRVAQFESLILPHLDAAYTFARYMLRDAHDAQDAVQDASLRAYRHFNTLRGGNARAWFLVIVRNVCRSQQRRTRSEERLTTSSEVAGDERAVEPIATDAAALRESDMTAIRRAVAALPAEFREVVVLRELNDLSYAEISKVVGIPIGTVMSRLARARRTLAQRLGHLTREVG